MEVDESETGTTGTGGTMIHEGGQPCPLLSDVQLSPWINRTHGSSDSLRLSIHPPQVAQRTYARVTLSASGDDGSFFDAAKRTC